MAKSAATEKRAIEQGTKIATEAISNIRTVASLSKFVVFLHLHVSSLRLTIISL